MNWNDFILFAIPSVVCWLLAGILIYFKKLRKTSYILMTLGILIFASFIAMFWIYLQRPPMRTMGETRLWYSLFLSLVGFASYIRWRHPWLLSFSAVMATVFVVINILKPEIHTKNLMPALQSNWFVPHVTSYILSYAMLAAATIGSIIELTRKPKPNSINASCSDISITRNSLYIFIDNMIYIGYGFLMLGLFMGAIWAKDAWGHYWSWDPKETWALITSLAYLGYIHLRLSRYAYSRITLWFIPLAFVFLMITWLGVNYLPSAQNSIHVYTS